MNIKLANICRMIHIADELEAHLRIVSALRDHFSDTGCLCEFCCSLDSAKDAADECISSLRAAINIESEELEA